MEKQQSKEKMDIYFNSNLCWRDFSRMASVIRLETKNKETPQDDDQSNIGAGVAIDAAEVLAGSLLCILPWTRPAGMFMVTDGVRRILNDLEENDNG